MKKMILGLVFVCSIFESASAADCRIYIDYQGLSGDRADQRIEKMIERQLNKLGYQRIENECDSSHVFKLITPSYNASGNAVPTGYSGWFVDINAKSSIKLDQVKDVSLVDAVFNVSFKQMLKEDLVNYQYVTKVQFEHNSTIN